MAEENQDALILTDLQNDFFPGGALAVPMADQLFPLVNELQCYFSCIIATKDWHPAHHKSFASNHPGREIFEVISWRGQSQVLWPDHCIPNTPGADFHPQLRVDRIQKIIYKGTDPEIDSYSGFFDNAHLKDTGLDAYLKSHHIRNVYILGLATDYCVLYSVLDALKLGYKTFLIEDACYGINQSPEDVKKAIQLMRDQGAIVLNSNAVMNQRKKLI